MSEPAGTDGLSIRMVGDTDLTEDEIRRMVHDVERGFQEEGLLTIEHFAGDHLLEHSASLGHVDFRQRAEIIRQVLGDATLKVHEVVVQGDIAVSRWTITGVHRGKWMGIPGTGRTVSVTGLAADRFEDHKAVEHWELPDEIALAKELEAAEADAQKAEATS